MSSRDNILTSGNGARYSHSNLTTQKWMNGQVVGVDKARAWLLERAGTMFVSNKDEEAKMLRKVAFGLLALGETLKAEAKAHETEFPSQLPPLESWMELAPLVASLIVALRALPNPSPISRRLSEVACSWYDVEESSATGSKKA